MQITQSVARSLNRLQNEPGSKGLLENALLLSLITLTSTAGMSSLAIHLMDVCTTVGRILVKFIV